MQEEFIKKYCNVIAKNIDLASIIKLRSINKNWYYLSRTIDFEILAEKVSSRKDKLKLLFVWYSWLPVQGSKEWIEQRQGTTHDEFDIILEKINGYKILKPPTIGGSEISSILGSNKYTSREDLIQRKIGNDVFNGNIDTRWGKMMEPVITMYTEHKFQCEINETGSVPGIRNENGHAISSYSPDGLAVIQKNILNTMFMDIADSEKIVLFEFKCPRRRKPTDKVPEHYLSQPLMGMCVIPIAELAIFGDGVFRMCSGNNFAWNSSYSTWFHNTDRGAYNNDPYALGVIGLWKNKVKPKLENPVKTLVCEILREIELSEKLNKPKINKIKLISLAVKKTYELEKMYYYTEMEIQKAIKYWNFVVETHEKTIIHEFRKAWKPEFYKRIRDFGMYGTGFEENIFHVDSNILTAGFWYPDDFLESKGFENKWLNDKTSEFIKWCWENNKEYLGIVPWKLMDIKYIHVPKQSDYLKKHMPLIKKTIDEIQAYKKQNLINGKSENPVNSKNENNFNENSEKNDENILLEYNDDELDELAEMIEHM